MFNFIIQFSSNTRTNNFRIENGDDFCSCVTPRLETGGSSAGKLKIASNISIDYRQVQRCCSAGQRLSHSFDAPNSPTCVDSDEGARFSFPFVQILLPASTHRSLPEVQGLDLSSERNESKIVLEEAQQTGFPTLQEYQVNKLV